MILRGPPFLPDISLNQIENDISTLSINVLLTLNQSLMSRIMPTILLAKPLHPQTPIGATNRLSLGSKTTNPIINQTHTTLPDTDDICESANEPMLQGDLTRR
jgi:hypothetical protein